MGDLALQAFVLARGGRAEDTRELIEALANGNPSAWAVVLGIVTVFVLAPLDQGTDADRPNKLV